MPIGDYYQEYGPIHRRRGRYGDVPAGEKPRGGDRFRRRRSTSPRTSPRRAAQPRERRERRASRVFRMPRLPSLSRLSRWQVAGIVVVMLLALPFVFPYGYSLFFYGRACPGVSIQGIPVGTLDQEAITTVVSARHTRFLRQPVTIVYGEQQWQPSASQVGLTFDPAEVAGQALERGRRGTPIDRLAELWRLWAEGIDIAPRATVDLNRLQDYLLSLRHSVEYPPRDATLAIAEGEVSGAPRRTWSSDCL